MKGAMTRTSEKTGKASGLHNTLVYMRQHWQLYVIFMLPAVLLTVIFRYIPMGGVLIAFTEYNPIRGILGSEWVGFSHFTRFLSSPDFMRYLMNTLKLSIFGLLWGFPAPILLAFLLNRILSSGIKQKIQLVLYMPNFISVIVLCGIVRILLSPTGMINMLLGTNYNFMTMPEAFRTIYIASGIWQEAGWGAIIYMATLSTVDTSLYEAAKVDGASVFQRILHIDIPELLPMAILQLILSASNLMNVGFEKVYLLQTELNKAASDIIAVYVYEQGILNAKYSYSTAIGLFNTIVNVVMLVIVNVICKRISDVSLW